MISGALYHLVTTYLLKMQIILRFEFALVLVPAGEPEVADLQITVLIEQQIAGLQVPMNHVGRVDVKQPTQSLVHEILNVLVGQLLLGVDHSMKIRFHQVCDDVDVFIILGVIRPLEVEQRNDVLVVKEFYIPSPAYLAA